MNPEARRLAQDAFRSAQAANEAMNVIDQASLPAGVWAVLFQQGEAIGDLCTAVLCLADGPGAA